jgi:polyisoprenoid-binding protein YceI
MVRGFAAVLGMALAATGMARAADYQVHPGGACKVVFVSKAPTETFEGKTNKMEGVLTLDPTAVGDSIHVHLEVDLVSLDTGIGKRNQLMRRDHLEVDKYPKAVFDGATVMGPAGGKIEAGKTTTFEIEGTFTIHGVSRRLRCKADAGLTKEGGADAIAFTASFPVALPDYSIRRPEFLFLKLAEVQDVHVTGVAVAATAPAAH